VSTWLHHYGYNALRELYRKRRTKMERQAFHRLLVLTVLVMTLVGLNAHPAVAADSDDDPTPRIAPIQTKPASQTYGHWAAEW